MYDAFLQIDAEFRVLNNVRLMVVRRIRKQNINVTNADFEQCNSLFPNIVSVLKKSTNISLSYTLKEYVPLRKGNIQVNSSAMVPIIGTS